MIGEEIESERKSWDKYFSFTSVLLTSPFPKQPIIGEEIGKEKLNRGEGGGIHL